MAQVIYREPEVMAAIREIGGGLVSQVATEAGLSFTGVLQTLGALGKRGDVILVPEKGRRGNPFFRLPEIGEEGWEGAQ